MWLISWEFVEESLVEYSPQPPGSSSSSRLPAASLNVFFPSNGLSRLSSSMPGFLKAVSTPLSSYHGSLNRTSPASISTLDPFNSVGFSQSSEIAPRISISNVDSSSSNSKGTAGEAISSLYTPIVTASSPGILNYINNSSSSNGTLGAWGSKSITNSKPTDLVNTHDFSSARPTSASVTSPGAISQSRFLASLQSASPRSYNGAGSTPPTTFPPLTGIRRPPTTSAEGLDSDVVTSTDTVEPSNASTESSTNSAWTEDFWLTTQRDGHTTVVPVVVGCSRCGDKGRGVILWNFPSLPRVSFQFPKLPSISFPCIPIPLIKTCSSPPRSKLSFDFPMLNTLISHRRRVWWGGQWQP